MQGIDQNIEKVFARMRKEFVDSTKDLLDDMDDGLIRYEKGDVEAAEILLYIQREIHNIKGQGGSFGHPLTGRVAHMLEDYLINEDGVSEKSIKHIRVYLDTMSSFMSEGEPTLEDEIQNLLNELPTGKEHSFSDQKPKNINILLVMPPGMQQKIVAKELTSCGFRVMRTYDCYEAVSVAMDILPDVVFINFDMIPYSGPELCHVFAAIHKLRNVKIILLTSHKAGRKELIDLPANVSIVQKQADFLEAIGELMIEWNIFGN